MFPEQIKRKSILANDTRKRWGFFYGKPNNNNDQASEKHIKRLTRLLETRSSSESTQIKVSYV